MVVLLLTGPRCSGKRTVAKILVKSYGFTHINIDDINYEAKVVTGTEAKKILYSKSKQETTPHNPPPAIALLEQPRTLLGRRPLCEAEFSANDDNFRRTPSRRQHTDVNTAGADEHVDVRKTIFLRLLLQGHLERMAKLEPLSCELLRNYDKNIVITSIRHLSELWYLRSRPYVICISVNASIDTRHDRYENKLSSTTLEAFSSYDLKAFVEADASECFGCQDCWTAEGENTPRKKVTLLSTRITPESFMGGISRCMELSDMHITNNDSLLRLENAIRGLDLLATEAYRPSFDLHFVMMATETAMRTNCIRRTVGAVITKDHKVVATGYNGTPTGTLNCLEGGCQRCKDVDATRGKDLHICVCVHAEANALLQAGLDRCRGGTIYVTCFPCLSCAKLIVQCEIQRIVYIEDYDDNQATVMLLKQSMATSSLSNLFLQLWNSYTKVTPRAASILNHLETVKHLQVVNDHIAFRTVSHPSVDINALGRLFEELGYVKAGNYTFPAKRLTAIHYEYPTANAEEVPFPKVFISQLELSQVGPFTKNTLVAQVSKIPSNILNTYDLLTYGSDLESCPDYETYARLLSESEYAAWLYVYSYVPNHFTISVNHLKEEATGRYVSLPELNEIIEAEGWLLSRPDGKVIQGTPADMLEQSSTLAEPKQVKFSDGVFRAIPSCYYEFAYRHVDPATGKLFQGFVTQNADKLFESTNIKSP